MTLVSKITAYGTPGIIAAGAAAIWGQSALVWVTQPSHLLPVAAITAVVATVAAKRKGKVAPEPELTDAQAQEQLQADTRRRAQEIVEAMREALPPAAPRVVDHTGRVVQRREV